MGYLMRTYRLIQGFRVLVLAALFAFCPALIQAQDVEDFGEDVYVSQPLFKGQLFQYAVKQYIEKTIRSRTSATKTVFYEAEIKITLKETGALKKVEIINSTGSDYLDRQIIVNCRDFVRKKHMTPAKADGNPIEYSMIVPLMIEFRDLNENQNSPRYYNWGTSYRGVTPSTVTSPYYSR